MSLSPLVTIVLPTHNRPEVLTFAIKSVLDQTVADFELFVIGDGCTDDTARHVAAFEDSRIRWFDLPKAPHFGYANINVALKEARGEFVAYMAHDDLWLPDHLELLLSFFEDDSVEIAYSRPLWVTPEGDLQPLSFNLHDLEVLEEFLSMKRNSLPASCFIFRSRCLEKYGGWNESIASCGDWDQWARIIREGGRKNFAYLSTPTCLHFRANWRTQANAGPLELKTWQYRSENQNPRGPAPAFKIPVERFPTEQTAFTSLLEAGAAAFSREIRSECQRLLDRVSMDGDLQTVPLIDRLQEQEKEIQKLGSGRGVFEHVYLDSGSGIIFGPGCFPDEQGERWLWREAQMMLLASSLPAKAVLTLHCGEAVHYDQFPLLLELIINGSAIETLVFKSSHKKQKVDFNLDRSVNEVLLKSSATFTPGECGINDDGRELSVLLTKVKIKCPRQADAAGLYPNLTGAHIDGH